MFAVFLRAEQPLPVPEFACSLNKGGTLLQGFLYAVVFLTCVAACKTTRRPPIRQTLLLLASYGLYLTWRPWFAAVLLGSTAMNFAMGEWLRRKASALALTIGVVFNLALLAAFKYLPELAAHSASPFARLAMPLGISFWTFQALSYLFDLYRGEELDPTFLEFALYMAFFPVTISGPVCRLPEMLSQFRGEKQTSWEEIAEGFRRIAIGIFMVQLAKLLGQGILGGDGINSGFDRATQWTGPDAWCLAIGFGLQLFFDFAGYSHMAIGAAKAMGLTIPENFARPFASTNASIFWTRWHMSLSFWIRDYVFLPLAMLRREIFWRNFVLILSMVLFGLWHRASLLFLIWGAYHGMLLVLHRQVQSVQRRFNWNPGRLWTAASWLITMAFISLGWIFFRANSPIAARQMLDALSAPGTYASHFLSGSLYLLVFGLAAGYALTILVINGLSNSSIPASPESRPRTGIMALLARFRWYWIPPLYALALLFLLIITFTRGPSAGQFMYNKF